MQIEGNFEVDAPRELVWERITDVSIMASCIPGCEKIEEIDSNRYRAIVAVGIGVIKARFDLTVEILQEDPPNEVHSRTSGQEGSRASSINALNIVRLTSLDATNTRVDYSSEISISGRLARFGLGVMRKYVQGVSDEFAEAFRARLKGDQEPAKALAAEVTKTSWMARLLKRFGVGNKSDDEDSAHRTDADAAMEVISAGSSAAQSLSSDNPMLHRPNTIDHAIELLDKHSASFPLAGGATLVAMKNAGLVEVDAFISLDQIAQLKGISRTADGGIRIGAMTRHRETASCDLLIDTLAVVRQAADSIANVPVRNMGTIGGSLAHADPAADYLAALVCVDATVELVGPNGKRTMAVGDFLIDWYETALLPAEIITAVLLPAPVKGYGSYRKVARVSGDYAIASCAISVAAGSGSIQLAVGGCGPAPLRDPQAEQKMHQQGGSVQAIGSFSQRLVLSADPVDDVRGSAAYRLNLIPRLVQDAIAGIPQQVMA